MKKLIFSLLVLVFSFGSIFASNTNFTKTKNDLIEQNLLNGINSDNFGLKTSSAYFLGENKSSKAVIPLLNMLHNEESDEARILAALSLIKIGNPIGVYAVKMAAKFDGSEKVRKLCTKFYNDFSKVN